MPPKKVLGNRESVSVPKLVGLTVAGAGDESQTSPVYCRVLKGLKGCEKGEGVFLGNPFRIPFGKIGEPNRED